MKTKVTEADLLAAVVAATTPPPDDPGVSIAEHMAATGMGHGASATALLEAVARGRLAAGMAYRVINGQRRRVRVYRPA